MTAEQEQDAEKRLEAAIAAAKPYTEAALLDSAAKTNVAPQESAGTHRADPPISGAKVIYDIHIRFIHPPIPDRNFDYQAVRSDYEPGEPIGRGPTPIAALADLLEQEREDEANG